MHFTKVLSVCCAILFGAFLSTEAFAQGNTCETALAVTPGSYTADGPADGVSEAPCSQGEGSLADWYSFTPAENGSLTVTSCLGGADTQLSIMEGTCGSLTCVANADDVCPVSVGGSSFAAEVSNVLVTGGVTYYIQWDNQWTNSGFDWSLSFVAATEPDCEGVIGGPALPGTACDDGNPDTNNDTWTEDCDCVGVEGCLNSTPFGSADLSLSPFAQGALDQISTCSFQTEYTPITNVPAGQDLEFTAVDVDPGVDSYITIREGAINGPVVAEGFSPVTYSGTSGADLFAHWTVDESCATATNCIVTTVQCLTCLDCEGVAGGPAVPGESCDDGDPATINDVYGDDCVCAGEAPDCPELLLNIGDPCDDGDPDTVNDEVNADCQCVGEPIVTNNDPCSATPLNCGAVLTDQSLAGATATGDDDCTGSGTVDVYYTFITDGTTEYVIAIDDPSFVFDGVVELLTGPDCDNLVVSQACSDFPESFSVTAAGQYWFRVRPWSSAEADNFGVSLTCNVLDCPELGLNIGDACDDGDPDTFDDEVNADCECVGTPVDCPGLGNIGDPCDDGDPDTSLDTVTADCECVGVPAPDNDNCEDLTTAQFLLDCGETQTGSTAGATITPDINNLCNGFTSSTPEDVWHAFSANGIDDYVITLLPGADENLDGVLFVYSGACGSLVEVACSDTGLTSNSGEAITLNQPANGIYYIRAYSWLSGPADYSISLECVDNCVVPFPGGTMNEASLNTVVNPSNVQLSWDPVPFTIGCQVRVRLAGGPGLLGQVQTFGPSVSGLTIPFGSGAFDPGTDYEWQVRCGCQASPIIATPLSSWQPFTTPGGAIVSSSPNPTEGQSFVTFSVASDVYTTLEVIDMSGRVVGSVFAGMAQANNEYRFEFDGSDLPNGIYIYRLTTDEEVVNEKFMIAR